ncbi:beta-lactamase/transpeptidase-like protein [Byssothecium circinans]|uniref:Beta-lactamase/transpeptidase-like protein n=1 Tax=Byssothecium circinans TaxID=147558 RepID=A0A6A5U2P2_9PLEO|nr:beta-lactamase/transpeptidase-like protein [Byssothecium circinans]
MATSNPKPWSDKTKDDLNTYISSFTSGDKPKLPGAIVHIVDAKNNVLFSHASGGGSQTLSTDTLFVILSVTKIIGAIAFMQLVDRGVVSLDDAEVIKKLVPELASKKVLTGSRVKEDGSGETEWVFEDMKTDITPRMLMSHCWGGGHSFFNKFLYSYLMRDGLWANANESND